MASSSSFQRKKRQDVWRNQERHYCAVCNAWMGGDRQSILIHENGAKHKLNMENSLQQKRQDKIDQDKTGKLMQSSLQAVERAAAAAHAQDVTYGGYMPVAPQPTVAQQPTLQISTGAEKEKQAWESKKKQREQEKRKTIQETEDENETTQKKKRRKIGLDEGHYNHGETIYLEGPTFSELLEDDMPIQVWVGSGFANLAEKRLPERHHHWRNGLVIATRKSSTDPSGIVLDVAYLMHADDKEETLEKSVSPNRVRLELGGDDTIPDTLEEARLAAMGGEVSEMQQPESLGVDENTGLSSWGTVWIRKTTVRNELKDERARARAKRREEVDKAERERKEAEARKMEEAKVENADDSALGAFDVWASGKAGYKGVDINQEAKLNVSDTAKSLAKGKRDVSFKKPGASMFKKAKRKQNRRTTSADDD